MGLGSYLVQFVLVLLVFFCWGHSQLVAETKESQTSSTIHVQPLDIRMDNSEQQPEPDGLTVRDRPDTGGRVPEFLEKNQQAAAGKIEATIINPVQSAAIAAEVGGIIERYNFEVGDRVREGEIIVEISRKRYALTMEKAKQNLGGLRLALKRAQRDKEIKDKLLSMDATSQQELLRAEAEFEITEHRVREAETTFQQSLLDLNACQVKAPFTGYLAIRYKEPFEAVGPLEKIFAFIDSRKVYAVAYVPEDSLPLFKKGSKAAFSDSSGKQFVGEVAKMEPLIDPKTGTKKIYVLMDNPEEQLGIGMTGSLEAIR